MSRWREWLGLDGRRTSAEAIKSAPFIADVIARAIGPDPAGVALEIGSGSGEHVIAWARRFPRVQWQPSDPDAVQRRSIDAWVAREELPNVRAAIDLDATKTPWPIDGLALVVLVHVLHIAPRAILAATVAEARRCLAPGGALVIHDAFLDGADRATSPRMQAFDADLRARGRPGLWRRGDVDRATAALEGADESTYDGDQTTLVYRNPR